MSKLKLSTFTAVAGTLILMGCDGKKPTSTTEQNAVAKTDTKADAKKETPVEAKTETDAEVKTEMDAEVKK